MVHRTLPTDEVTIVAVPHARDGVGEALRDVYRQSSGLPDDMIAMLARLDGHRVSSGCCCG